MQHPRLSKVDRLCLHLPMLLGFFLSSKPLNFIMYAWWKHRPSSPHCCHRHLLYLVLITFLLPLLCGISPVYSTEHILKYRSIEMFMKLPYQRVVIHLKPSPNEVVMPVSLLALCAVQKFSECTPFNVLAITACRNLRLTWFLIRWNVNFVKLLNIQKYAAICFWGRAGHWWEQYLLVNSSEDVNDLDHVVFGM